MNTPDKGLGIISVLLKRFEEERLPGILSIKKKVEAGETLDDGELEFLRRILEEARANVLWRLLERHPAYRDHAASVISTCRRIVEQGLENEKRGRGETSARA
jgi:hypothetical protein